MKVSIKLSSKYLFDCRFFNFVMAQAGNIFEGNQKILNIAEAFSEVIQIDLLRLGRQSIG